jgi:hypothetical protein
MAKPKTTQKIHAITLTTDDDHQPATAERGGPHGRGWIDRGRAGKQVAVARAARA